MKTKKTTANTTAFLLTSALAGGAAHGAVIYTNFSNLTIQGRNGAASFDLSPDLISRFSLLYQDANSQKPEVRGDGINSFILSRTWQNTNNMDMGNRTYGGLPLTPGGVMVDSQMRDVNANRQQNGITNLMVQANGYFVDRPDSTDGDTGGDESVSNVGDWGKGPVTSSGYVGLVMVNGGVTNFGWAHFKWTVPSNSSEDPNALLTLVEGAYESTPNKGILTGEGAPNPPAFSSVPDSQQTYSGAFIKLAATVDGALSYRWKAGAVGSGVYTNLSDAGNISGSATPSLAISSATPANTADYVLEASNPSGPVTSPPATLTIQNPGPTPTTGEGWFNAFQAQTDLTYSGGRGSISYRTSSGKVYWLFNEITQGTMDPATLAFTSTPVVADNRILLANGDARVCADFKSGTLASIPPATAAYYMVDMFEANGFAYALLGRTDIAFHFNQLGSQLAKYSVAPNGLLTFQGLFALPDTGIEGGTLITSMQWNSAAVAQNGYVYVFGDYNNGPGTFVARIPAANIETPGAWTYWNGTSWDAEIINAVPALNSPVTSVRLYQGAWVALNKSGGMMGTDTYAYAAAQPQGPYTEQLLFSDPLPGLSGIGMITNSATGQENAYVSADPASHPEYPLTSGKLLVSIGYWDASQYTYNLSNAGLFKPRFYEVTLTNLPPAPVELSIKKDGSNIVLSWDRGTLLEATTLSGTWTTNAATSPYTNAPSAPQKFYRVQE